MLTDTLIIFNYKNYVGLNKFVTFVCSYYNHHYVK